ncbi:SusC/RagA family TonB-linked outer membrane protein [Polaribacter cellanae]|uniref:SusC/RagA family TonB-linked outer membrane protein n=1 Tax=Polaribacter cellanae TaxID=2818493 RepID=A0A975H9F8_9FLAO|nr:SusC/RagA family TonB-linked outer membrane protein [Polaribacter cellanae]QTE22845.1 SusC/RagA family TonB-linked outer membrane protein [Polaribacter cellanae]
MQKNLLIAFLICSNFLLQAQKTVIKGKVLDKVTKTSLPGVNIFNVKKTRGTSANFNGEFKMTLKLGDTIIFNAIGYKTKKQVALTTNLIVYLEEQTTQLDEVVINTKTNINDTDIRKATGAITTVAINKIRERPSVNVIESLQGQVAGLTIQSDGELGKPLKIRIRGTTTLPIKTATGNLTDEQRQEFDNRANQPLFVLDGQVITPEAFATLNVNDIQEMKVLKDAAANALYGIKAANGVIEITSKRGINGKTQYSFSLQQGITLKGEPSIKMMGTTEKLEFERRVKNTSTPGYNLSEEYFRRFFANDQNLEQLIADGQRKLDSLKKIDNNWFNKLSRISTFQSYNISTRGGNETNRFYISGNFTEQGGKFAGNEINRFTARLNYEYNVSKKIYIMLNSGFGMSKSSTPNASNYSPTDLIYKLNPYEQMEEGVLVSYPNRTYADLINQYSRNSQDNRFNFSGNLSAKFTDELNLNSVVGVDYLFQRSLAIVPRDAFSEVTSGVPEKERGRATKNQTTNINFSTNTRLNYEKTIDKHQISASANVDYYRNKVDFIGINGYGLPSKLSSGAGINNDISGSRRSTTSSRNITDAQLGFGFSGLYNYNDTYEIYGSYKTDGSSLMPKDKRWNKFWAIGIGYTLSNESFLKNNNLINYLKLRATYGVTANLAGIDASLAVPTFAYTTKSYNGNREFSLRNLFNEGLRPEENTSINLGIDIGIANKLNLAVEAYKRRTRDMLLTVPIAPSNGFTQQLRNVGVMDNKGLEFSINATILNTKYFTWSTSANLSYNENVVVDLYEGTELSLTGQRYPDYKEGESADIIYGLISLGIHPVDGITRYQGANGRILSGVSGAATSEDFVVLGNGTAPYNGGWYHSLTYKNWQLSFDLYYNFGGIARFTNQSVITDDLEANKNGVAGQLENTWFEPGDENKIYQSLEGVNNQAFDLLSFANNRTVGKTDFIRLNNIMLRYQFDDDFLRKISNDNVTSSQFYLQLKNIATWSNFGGGDPESANLVGSAQPVITMGFNLSF